MMKPMLILHDWVSGGEILLKIDDIQSVEPAVDTPKSRDVAIVTMSGTGRRHTVVETVAHIKDRLIEARKREAGR